LQVLCEHTAFLEGATRDGSVGGLDAVTGLTRPEAFAKLQTVTGVDAMEATEVL